MLDSKLARFFMLDTLVCSMHAQTQHGRPQKSYVFFFYGACLMCIRQKNRTGKKNTHNRDSTTRTHGHGIDGTHAGGISVELKNIKTNQYLFKTFMDNGGRLNEIVSPELIDENAIYELVFGVGKYWKKVHVISDKNKVLNEIVIRFKIIDRYKKYHMPIILSPNSYSTWWSDGE